jgi:hypothetical protein
MKKICEGQTHRKPHFVLEKVFLHLAVSFCKNLKVNEYMKKICEGQTHRKPHFDSLLEKGSLHLAGSLDKNLKVTEFR